MTDKQKARLDHLASLTEKGIEYDIVCDCHDHAEAQAFETLGDAARWLFDHHKCDVYLALKTKKRPGAGRTVKKT